MNNRNIEAIYPLSPVQQAMLFHTLFDPGSSAYFSQLNCNIRGDLKAVAFEQAWQKVLERHSILRSAFVWEGVEQPLQVVGRKVKLTLEEQDLTQSGPTEQQQRLEEYLKQDQRKGFKLSKGPLLRLALFKLSEDNYQLIWSYHHLLLDGWSWPLVIQEVLAFYDSLCKNEELQLKPSRPYMDYIGWLLKQDASKAEAFWKQSLKGLTAPTRLSLAKTPETLSDPGKIYFDRRVAMPTELMARLQSVAKHYQLTLNTLVQGSWALLLSRYSGEQDVIFGVTSSGRPVDLQGVENMVGVFINTLPVRVHIAFKQPIAVWLRQLQAQQVEMRQYEFSPLTQVQGWSEIPRTQPLFENIFVFQNYPVSAALPKQSKSLDISVVGAVENTNYPITVVGSAGCELELKIAYDSRLFDSNAIARMFGHMRSLLSGIAADPDKIIGSLSPLTEDEQYQLLTKWNETSEDLPSGKCFHRLFEQQAAQAPDAIAVEAEGGQLTYRELNCRANQLARHLKSVGVEEEGLVGIFMQRSLDMLVGILAAFKAGAAYVPLDLNHPKERVAFILADARVRAILSHQNLMQRLPDYDSPVICFDTDREAIASHSVSNIISRAEPESLAYVIYTSGSTGVPKGAMIEHKGMLNHLYAKVCDLQLTAADVVAQTASQCFDISVWQFLAALLVRGRVNILADEITHDPSRLLEKIEQTRVTIWEAVPSLLRSALESIRSVETTRHTLSTLSWLLVTGEAFRPELCRDWMKVYPGIALMNAYGPTECSDDVTHYRIDSPPSANVAHMPIGRPVRNTQAYILDDHLRPAPIGVSGELYFGGAGVGRGYLNEAGRTAEAFLPDPFFTGPGARLYRTGDIAWYKNDGIIEYLGRGDQQVKVRGFRIETGEIELMLNRHPGVEQAVVAAVENAAGENQLAAYIVSNEKHVPSTEELKNLLRERLPDYMIPSFFIMLDKMPTTSNGKLDRRALPAPDPNLMSRQAVFVAPETEIEKTQARIWADVLKVEDIGIEDNFFDLGGHSLVATQLISRLREAFGVDLTMADFFDSATIKDTSKKIETTLMSQTDSDELDEMLNMLEALDETEANNSM